MPPWCEGYNFVIVQGALKSGTEPSKSESSQESFGSFSKWGYARELKDIRGL